MLLGERDMHGYDMIAELDTRTQGRWRPSPGAVYPALARLEHKGLISGLDAEDDKRLYSLTDEGQRWNERRDPDAPAPWDESADQPRGGELRGAMAELAGTVRQVGRFGSEAQKAAALEILTDARSRMYRVLADGPANAEPSSDES